jgi:L-lactate dehydrogenase complex protein LldG
MQTLNTSRDKILEAIRVNLPKTSVEHPKIPTFKHSDRSLKSEFKRLLRQAGGDAHDVASVAEAEDRVTALHPAAKVICSAVPEIGGTRRAVAIRDPHELADVDLGIIRAQFGVAENGAIWLTQEDLVVDALAVLSQHLVVLLDPKDIVGDMHDAYRRVHLNETSYGCFMMGPSATADIEATLVHGAQGARSLDIFFLPSQQTSPLTVQQEPQ